MYPNWACYGRRSKMYDLAFHSHRAIMYIFDTSIILRIVYIAKISFSRPSFDL
jgi:hypothetical protein